ncbi:MAG: Tfp pilus assembly protein PilX [Phycisphaerales bacterium]|jgi:Tfp pilus assembly protein PilX
MTRATPHHDGPATSSGARGYILVVTLLLLMVVGLLAASTAQRQVSSSLTVKRQIDSYREHHGAMGLQSAVQMWLRVQKATSITGLLGPEGHAFDLEFADGSTISVYLNSGQGTALSNLASVDSEIVVSAARIIQDLNTRLPNAGFQSVTRNVGPVAIDLAHADEAVVRAATTAVTDDVGKADLLASALLQNRGGATRNTLSQAGMDAELSAEERTTLYNLITTTTTLWRVHLEVRRGAGRGEVVARYEGMTVLNTRGAGIDKDFTVSGGFLEWAAVPMDQGPGRTR